MWPPKSDELGKFELVMDSSYNQQIQKFEPTPYIFTKIENGKKKAIDSSSTTPPITLLLDHAIAVIWIMFKVKPILQQLSIDDLKWAYEFLKRVKNKKGENPPDVKVCLSEIQDRLITLYASSTNTTDEYFDEIAAAFGDQIMGDSTENCNALTEKKLESAVDKWSSSPKKAIDGSLSYTQRPCSAEFKSRINNNDYQATKREISIIEEDSDLGEGANTAEETEYEEGEREEEEEEEEAEVEKYVLSLFKEHKGNNPMQSKSFPRSKIPKKKKRDSHPRSKAVAYSKDPSCELTKNSKRVHCYAEMRSLKFQKSTKLKDTNGEEAAYSNLKAEIQRLTIDPKASRGEVMKFLKDWRSEQVDRLHNELKRLSSIEEFMKSLKQEEVNPNKRLNSQLTLKELELERNKYSWQKSLISSNQPSPFQFFSKLNMDDDSFKLG